MSLFVRHRAVRRSSLFAAAGMLVLPLMILGWNSMFTYRPVKAQPGMTTNLMVRGYLTAAVTNNSDLPATHGLPIRGKAVYLPGVEVYLQDVGNNTTSSSVRTD